MAAPARIDLPIENPPRIMRASRALHAADRRTITYRYENAALHLYEYPARVFIGGQEFAIFPGDVTLTPPRTPKQYDFGRDGTHWCIHFLPDEARKSACISLPVHLRLGPYASHAAERLRDIILLWEPATGAPAQERLRQAEARHRLQALLLWLAQNRQEPPASRRRRTERGIEAMLVHIRENLRAPLDVGLLAEVAGLSRNYLARRFKARFGMTMLRYVLECRIARARELIETTDAPIQSIAAQVGIADLQRFNKAFRRVTGSSPSAARAATHAARSRTGH